jgi:homoaconitase/3-isopropylmalate dehydratase large subunit
MAAVASLVKIEAEECYVDNVTAPEVEVSLIPSLKVVVSGSAALKLSTYDVACQVTAAVTEYDDQDYLLELSGAAIERLTLGERIALLTYLARLVTPMVFIEPDQSFLSHLQRIGESGLPVPFSDKNSHSLDTLDLMLRRGRHNLYDLAENRFVDDLSVFAGRRMRRIRIGPLVGGTLSDIKALSSALKGHRVPPGLEVVVIPMTQRVFVDAAKRRLVQYLLEAGVRIGNTCCDPPLEPLDVDEYELTTEIQGGEQGSFLGSINALAQACRSGKITRKILEMA